MSPSSPTARQLVADVPEHLRRRLTSARELGRERRRTRRLRPIGVDPIDRLLGGGAERGRLIEVIGRPGSGRFSIALTALAAATSSGETAALIDLGDALDPQNAALLGIDLERLLWTRPEHLKTALHTAESVVAAGFPLVVIDLGVPPVPGGRGAEAVWIRLARTTAEHQTLVLVTTPYRASGSAAATVLRTERGRARWSGSVRDRNSSPRLLEGLGGRIGIVKMRFPHHAPTGTPFFLASRTGPLLRQSERDVLPRHPERAERVEGSLHSAPSGRSGRDDNGEFPVAGSGRDDKRTIA